MNLADLPDRIVLALTIWGESRSEPVEGQIAVACVVRNRLKKAGQPVKHWKDICLAPLQFSCFNPDDPNFEKVQKAADMAMTALPTPELLQAMWIADGVIAGKVIDNTLGSTHYLTSALFASKPPAWAMGQTPTVTIGHQVFLDVA
jgi:N-acetylmuramoyl-L-alanine amidase